MKATQSAPPLSERDLNLLQPYLQKPISVATCFCLDVHLRFIPTSVPHSEDIYFFHSFPCKRAKVCGIVVGLIIGEARLVYMIDDGTAVLECVCWLRNKPREEEKGWIEANAFRVGQTVFIVGQIDSYKEERQLTVQSLNPAIHLDDETKHILDCTTLLRTTYTQAFSIAETMKTTSSLQDQNNSMHLQLPGQSSFSIPRSSYSFSRDTSIDLHSTSIMSEASYLPSSSSSGEDDSRTFHESALSRLDPPSKLKDSNLNQALFKIYINAYFERHAEEEISLLTLYHNKPLKSLAKRVHQVLANREKSSRLSTSFSCSKSTGQTPMRKSGNGNPSSKGQTMHASMESKASEEDIKKLFQRTLYTLARDGTIVEAKSSKRPSLAYSEKTKLREKEELAYVLFRSDLLVETIDKIMTILTPRVYVENYSIPLAMIVEHLQEADDLRYSSVPVHVLKNVVRTQAYDGSSRLHCVEGDRFMYL